MRDYIRKLVILFALCLLAIGNYSFLIGIDILKFIRFLPPIILLLLLRTTTNVSLVYKKEHSFFNIIFVLYAYSIIHTVISSIFFQKTGFTYRNLVNCLTFIIPLITCYGITRATYKEKNLLSYIDFIFYLYVFFNLIFILKQGKAALHIFNSLSDDFLTGSENETESIDSLVFCFYTILYISRKRKWHLLIALILTIIGAKRIAIGGLALSIFSFYLHLYFSSKKKIPNKKTTRISILFTVLSFIPLIFWLSLYAGSFDDTISDITGTSANGFLMGRAFIAESFFSNIHGNYNFFIGLGLGYIENILLYIAQFPTLFHNDFLRLYLELGVIPFTVWLFVHYKYSLKSSFSFSIFLLLLILIQTDNVIIYDKVMTPLYLMFIWGIREQKSIPN